MSEPKWEAEERLTIRGRRLPNGDLAYEQMDEEGKWRVVMVLPAPRSLVV